jgi:purine-binding chemotaxis protein CheW
MTPTTGTVAQQATASDAAPEWVVFACAGHSFALPLGKVREVLEPRPFTRLPGCGPAVCGLVGVRGRVITVFDFGAAVSLRPAAPLENHRLILVDHGERVFGLVVDGILAVARTATAELPLGADQLRAFDIQRDDLFGIGTFADQPFLAIDPERLLARLLP